MRIKKYDADYSRRFFMEKTAKGMMGAGVLSSLWPLISNGDDLSKAYPEELRSLEAYTKGKVKEGDVITADNVEFVKDLLDPVAYIQVSQMGRRIRVRPQTTNAADLHPYDYFEATVRNQGQAVLDANNNVVVKGTGKPWIGGTPFTDPQTGLEVYANVTLSWGRHDTSLYAVEDYDLGPSGDIEYRYSIAWCEMNTTARVSDPDGPYMEGEEDKLRYQSVWFTAPQDVKGTAFLNIWKYDQREFPDLFGYLPAFKRVRRFPTNQRFEPLVPGSSFFLSDAWAAGDPMLTWGNYKIVGRQPMLGAQSGNWEGDKENWSKDHLVHGGAKGNTFYEVEMEFCPECIVAEAEPTGYPRAPVGKKRVYVDLRNHMFIAYVTFDRRGEIWRSFEAGFGQRVKGDLVDNGHNGHPEWTFTYVHAHDVQTNRITRFNHPKAIKGGMASRFDFEGAKSKYMTVQALRRLGS